MPEKLIMKCGANAQESHVYLVLEDGTQRELLRCRRVVIDTGDAQLQDSPRATVEMWANDFDSTIEITHDQAQAIIRCADERSMSFLDSEEASEFIQFATSLNGLGRADDDDTGRSHFMPPHEIRLIRKIADVLKRREDLPF